MKNALFVLVHLGLALMVAQAVAQKPDQVKPRSTPDQVAVPDQVVQTKTYQPDQVVQTKTYQPDQVVQKTSARCFYICPSPEAIATLQRIDRLDDRPCQGLFARIARRCLERRLARQLDPEFPPIGPW